MNEKALRTLEYTKIIERLTELAGSSIGKELCRNLKPSSNLAEIEAAQKQTSDALSRIYQRGSISFSGVQDVRGSLKRLEIGGSLSALELLRIAKLLETTSRVKSFGRLENSDREKDSLDDMFDGLQPLANLYNEIYRCILSEDEIADDASPALAKIRRSIRQGSHPAGFPGERLFQNLPSRRRNHDEKRPLLRSCQIGVQGTGSRHDPRPVFHRFHPFHRAHGHRKTQ